MRRELLKGRIGTECAFRDISLIDTRGSAVEIQRRARARRNATERNININGNVKRLLDKSCWQSQLRFEGCRRTDNILLATFSRTISNWIHVRWRSPLEKNWRIIAARCFCCSAISSIFRVFSVFNVSLVRALRNAAFCAIFHQPLLPVMQKEPIKLVL